MDPGTGIEESDNHWPGELKWGRMAVSEEVGTDEEDSPFGLFGLDRSLFDQVRVDGLLGNDDQTIMLKFSG